MIMIKLMIIIFYCKGRNIEFLFYFRNILIISTTYITKVMSKYDFLDLEGQGKGHTITIYP